LIKSVFVQGKTLDDTWFQLLYNLDKYGRINHIDSGSFEGSNRLEFDYAAGTIEYPTTRPLAPIMPDGVPPVATDESIEKYFVNYLMNGRDLEENEHYRYATWITGGSYILPRFSTKFFSGNGQVIVEVPNQLQWCIDHYKKKGFGTNHCYIQIGYPESCFAYDMPYTNEAERNTSPCLRGIDTKIIKDGDVWKLCCSVVFRSWDLYGAWPENMGGIVMLMEYMAGELGVEVGTLSFASSKLHCYDFQLNALKGRLNCV